MATTGNNVQSIVLLIVLLCDISKALDLKTCKTIDACRASTDRGNIDLWPLIKASTPPRFKNIKGSNSNSTNLYSWNPCEQWHGNNLCQNDTSVCLSIKGNNFANIGHASSAEFVLDSGICSLTYKGEFAFDHSEVKIELHCDTDEGKVDPFTCDTTSTPIIYNSKLYSKYACPQRVSGLSIGSVLSIIFFCLVFVYLIGGMLWMKFSRGATGKAMLPNSSFWANFFKLVEEGCVFTFDKTKGLCTTGSAGYHSI